MRPSSCDQLSILSVMLTSLSSSHVRAAIAARMAKLGGRGMFAPPVLAPKPAAHRQPSSEPKPAAQEPAAVKEEPTGADSATTDKTEDDKPAEAPAGAEESVVPSAPGLLVMPKRAAPPRRKQPTPKPSATDAAPKSPVANAPDEHPVPYAPNPDETPIPKTAEQIAEEKRLEELGQGENGAEGAQQAGIALAPVGQTAQQAVDQPLVASPVEESSATVAAGSDVPTSEPAQAELQHVSPTVPHQERSLVAEPDEEAVSDVDAPTSAEADARAHAPQHRTSIPLPERESSHHEDTAEFRTAIDTPSALGPRQAFMTPATERQTPTFDHADEDEQRKKEELAADTPFPKTGGIVPLPPVKAAGPAAPEEAGADDREKGTIA